MITKDEDAEKAKRAMAIKRALEEMANEAAMEMDRQRLLARFAKMKFDAHIAEGFTETQALVLCRP